MRSVLEFVVLLIWWVGLIAVVASTVVLAFVAYVAVIVTLRSRRLHREWVAQQLHEFHAGCDDFLARVLGGHTTADPEDRW